MMELMEVPQTPSPNVVNANGFDEFLQTGRTGRRNAVPEIEPETLKQTHDLPVVVEKLACCESTQDLEDKSCPSSSSNTDGSTSSASDVPPSNESNNQSSS